MQCYDASAFHSVPRGIGYVHVSFFRPSHDALILTHHEKGYVGNKAAVFPLQLLGLDVDVLNSCSLSNHTGYPNGAPGARLTGNDFRVMMTGLENNGLLDPVTHVLTGFIGTPSFLRAVADTINSLRSRNQALEYVCDPVLGDNGKLYVPAELVDIYRSQVLPLASVLTPNLFELGLLAGVPTPTTEADAFAACSKLHDLCPLIVLTGAQFIERPHTVSILVSEKNGNKFALDAELLKSGNNTARFTGSGDLAAALTLAWRGFEPRDLRKALTNVMATISAVLQRTLRDSDANNSNTFAPLPELRLIQSRDDILSPPVDHVRVREISGGMVV